MNKKYAQFKNDLSKVENAITIESYEIDATSKGEESMYIESNMDSLDFTICLLTVAISTLFTTNEAAEKWLAEVHDVANKQSGDYDVIQLVFGKMLQHKGDNIDWFKTRNGDDDPYRLFHRIFWGHDPLINNTKDNPFYLMVTQKGNLFGVVQAVRHLIADTFSKQGLPVPGHSYLEYEKEGGRPWNYLIDLVQQLSQETTGNKAQAEKIYEHLLTIRAQDIVGELASTVIIKSYIKIRGINNNIRATQIKLVSYTMSFYAQSIVGAIKQKGVPYINIPLGMAIAKEFVSLIIDSNKITNSLERKTNDLEMQSKNSINEHARLKKFIDFENTSLSLKEKKDEC